MPDENRFAGLSDVEEGPEEPEEEQDTEQDQDAESEEAGPAFEFDETTAKSIYVRPETLELLEDTEFEVEMLLRREHGLRDVTGREFHDAAVRVIEEHVDDIVDEILDARESEES
jgi:hypothetical protein